MKQIYDPLNNDVNWKDKIILIVEDVEPNFHLLKNSLHKTKVNILWASTGNEAIEICKNNPDVDVVLMDVHLPDISGHQATREIKKIRKEITVIAQTAFVFSGERQKSIDAGSDDYIAKPIRANELIYKIRNCLINKKGKA